MRQLLFVKKVLFLPIAILQQKTFTRVNVNTVLSARAKFQHMETQKVLQAISVLFTTTTSASHSSRF